MHHRDVPSLGPRVPAGRNMGLMWRIVQVGVWLSVIFGGVRTSVMGGTRPGWWRRGAVRRWTLLAWLGTACWSPPPTEPTPTVAKKKDKRLQGRWRAAPVDVVEQLERLGYVEGSRPAPGFWGVATHAPDKTAPGWNLYTSGHAPGAWLIDARGTLVHSWRASWRSLFPKDRLGVDNPAARYWRRVALLDDGGVVAIFEGLGMVRLARDGEVLWAKDNRAHHDLQVDGETLWVLTRTAHVVASVDEGMPVLEDFVVKLDARTGEEEGRWSLLKAVERGIGPVRRTSEPGHEGDVLHTNALELLDAAAAAALPGAEAGDVLVSFLALDTVAAVNLERGAVVWSQKGPWKRQHDPHVVDGSLLVFDNHAGAEASRVVRWTPKGVAWSWNASGGLWSDTCGTAAPLPNGNVLVTESDAGRAWETTPSGEVVWAFVSPHRAGARNHLVATLFDVVRVSALPESLRPN